MVIIIHSFYINYFNYFLFYFIIELYFFSREVLIQTKWKLFLSKFIFWNDVKKFLKKIFKNAFILNCLFVFYDYNNDKYFEKMWPHLPSTLISCKALTTLLCWESTQRVILVLYELTPFDENFWTWSKIAQRKRCDANTFFWVLD